MNIAEILRKLADTVDGGSQDTSRPTNSMPHAELTSVEVDNTDNTEATVAIPPLQAKLELLKKSMGMDSAYDQECSCGCDPCECDQAPDELAIIKQNAGIPFIAVQEMSDDDGAFEG